MPAAKPTSEHERDGTLRKDRHDDRVDGMYPKGPPAMPDGLDGHQQYLWNLVVENVPERVLSPADAAELLMLTAWWSQWRILELEVRDETDAKQRLFLLNQLAMSSKRVSEGLKHFGMSPAARTALKVSGKSKPTGALAALMEMRTKQLKSTRN